MAETPEVEKAKGLQDFSVFVAVCYMASATAFGRMNEAFAAIYRDFKVLGPWFLELNMVQSLVIGAVIVTFIVGKDFVLSSRAASRINAFLGVLLLLLLGAWLVALFHPTSGIKIRVVD